MLSSAITEAKLLENLTLAYETHDHLRNFALLPDFQILSTNSLAHQVHQKAKRAISIYRQLVNDPTRVTKILGDQRVLSLIGAFLDSRTFSALRVVISSKPIQSDGTSGGFLPEEFTINDPSSPGKQAVLDTAADLQARQKSELDRDRGSYISKLVIERRTEAERKRIQLEAVRYRQFLGHESNGDRLRLDVLASKLQLARQALSSEDVVLSRNLYISKCAELIKSCLQQSLNIMQQVKQINQQMAQLRQDLLSECSQFLEDVIMLDRSESSKRVLEVIQDAEARPLPVFHSQLPNSLITESTQRGSQLLAGVRADAVKAKVSFLSAVTKSKFAVNRLPTQQSSINRSQPQLPSSSIDGLEMLSSTTVKGQTEMKSDNAEKQKESALGEYEDRSDTDAVDGVEISSAEAILQAYDAACRHGVQEFELAVSQSMSRSLRLALQHLESKFIVEDASGGGGAAAAAAAASIGTLTVGPLDASEAFTRQEDRARELAGARDHFERLRSDLADEIRGALQRVSNSELKQQVDTIERMQERLRGARDDLKKAKIAMEALNSVL